MYFWGTIQNSIQLLKHIVNEKNNFDSISFNT